MRDGIKLVSIMDTLLFRLYITLILNSYEIIVVKIL